MATTSPMRLYATVINSHQTGIHTSVFQNKDAAIQAARENAATYARRPEDIQEHPYPGYVLYISYGPEGDAVWVTEVVVNLTSDTT